MAAPRASRPRHGAGEVQEAGGGGVDQDRNKHVPQALMKLATAAKTSGNSFLHRQERKRYEGAPHLLKAEDSGVRLLDGDPQGGGRSITWNGHCE